MKRDRELSHELNQEMAAHIEEKAAELMESGVPETEARERARREFGNTTFFAEKSREVWRWPSLDRFWQDVRFGWRMMWRNPGFTAVVVLTLALGIGVNTAIFSVANTVLFEPLPYPDAERILWLTNYDQRGQAEVVAGPDYFDWRNQARSLDGSMAFEYGNEKLAVADDTKQILVARILGDFWTVMGVHPALGRTFTPGEPDVVILGYPLFERQFNSDPHIIGRSVSLDGDTVTVIGVMPKDFRFLFPTQGVFGPRLTSWEMEAYAPDTTSEASQTRQSAMAILNVVGKRKAGTPIESVRAELQAIQTRVTVQIPDFYNHLKLRVLPLRDRLGEGARPALLVLLASVGFVLLIACANVANLLLARATSRQREISIRSALGAGRARVVRQFLTESLMLALMGGALGLLLARWGIAFIVRFGPTDVLRLKDVAMNGWVLGFTLVTSILTGLVFGIGPALASSKASLNDVLKEGSRTSPSSASRRMRGLLVAGELALALVLLTGAGLMVKSFWKMNARTQGFDPARTLVMKLSLSGPQYRTPEAGIAYTRELLRRLDGAPGVTFAGISGAGYMDAAPLDGAPPPPPGQTPMVISFRAVSEGYLHAVGMRLVQGRWMTDREPADVVMVNQSVARRVFRGENPVGKRIGISLTPHTSSPATIVGVVADLKYAKLDADPAPEVYVPYPQLPLFGSMDVVIRTAGDPRALAPDLRKLISGIDREQPVNQMTTLEQALADSIAPRRFNMLLLGIFAGIAVLLAAVGIYGVMSYAVTQRTQEIGVRMALGAHQDEVVRMVVRQGMGVIAVGVGAGLAAALLLTRLMAGLLYEVKPSDPQTLVVVCVALGGAALLACWIPARKAAQVDPVVALRYD
jgi:putative ABC transport system permease protein